MVSSLLAAPPAATLCLQPSSSTIVRPEIRCKLCVPRYPSSGLPSESVRVDSAAGSSGPGRSARKACDPGASELPAGCAPRKAKGEGAWQAGRCLAGDKLRRLGSGCFWRRNVPHPCGMAGIRPAPTADSMGTCGDAWLWVLPQLRDSGSSPMRNDPAHMGRPSPGCRCLLQRLRRLRTEPGVRPGSWMGTQNTLDGLSPTLHPRPSDTYLEVAPVAPTTQRRSSGTDTR